MSVFFRFQSSDPPSNEPWNPLLTESRPMHCPIRSGNQSKHLCGTPVYARNQFIKAATRRC